MAASASVELVAPIDVIVPPGNTGLDPSQTSFSQVFFEKFIQLQFFCILLQFVVTFGLYYI